MLCAKIYGMRIKTSWLCIQELDITETIATIGRPDIWFVQRVTLVRI